MMIILTAAKILISHEVLRTDKTRQEGAWFPHCFPIAVAERPQHMLMRVSVGIHGEDLPAVIEVTRL